MRSNQPRTLQFFLRGVAYKFYLVRLASRPTFGTREGNFCVEEEVVRFPRPIPINSLADYWIRDYRANRYLQRLSKNDLLARIADIVSNLMALGDDGMYRPRFRVREEDRIYSSIRNLDFLRMATDTWEEMRLRGDMPLPTPDPKRSQVAKRFSDESWCERPDWIAKSRLAVDKYEKPRMLFRFSKTRWNKEFIQAGRVRISPASYYNDTAAINAVRDDELRLQWYDTQLTQKVLEVKNYYCLCLSSEYDYRLFVDFQSDSCIAIKDPVAFSQRLRHAISQHNKENPASRISQLTECPVIYVDPFKLAPPELTIEVQFCKHFRFAYQTEFRFVLAPAEDRQLEPFFLNLGTIRDIAEMVMAPEATDAAGAI